MEPQTATHLSDSYVEQWLQSVADGTYTMSQRKLSSLKKKGVDVNDLIKKAKACKLHLLSLKDDTGEELIAASKDEFIVLC